MELLSFTYLLIELGLVAIIVWGLLASWLLFFLGVASLALYPVFYELFLALCFRVKFALSGSLKAHAQRHLTAARTNGLLYHPLFNLGFFRWTAFQGFDLNRAEHVLETAIARRPELNFAFVSRANEPDYAVIYRFSRVSQLIFMNYSAYLSYVFDQPWFLFPGVLLRLGLLRKYLHQVQGTLNGVCLALEKGCAVSLGGGFHHASANSSSGLCPYNDIGLAVQYLWHFHPERRNVLVVDLDAHQGNGHARDKALLTLPKDSGDPARELLRKRIYVFDMFNAELRFPGDERAKALIDLPVTVGKQDSDESYLRKLSEGLETVRLNFSPDFVVYNAGTDCLFGDPVGAMGLTARGIRTRDEMVFSFAKEQKAPVLMLLSGGLTTLSIPVISDSIINLTEKFPGLRYEGSRLGR